MGDEGIGLGERIIVARDVPGNGPLLVGSRFAGRTARCWRHGPLLAARRFADGTALCRWNALCLWDGPLLVHGAQFAGEIITLGK